MKNNRVKWFAFLYLIVIQVGFGQKSNTLVTGRYGLTSLVVKKDSIFGVFRYYDKYNKEFKDYESKNDYYFYGKYGGLKDTIKLVLTNPYEKQVFGDTGSAFIVFKNDTMNYIQTGLEGMFQPVYFPDKINEKAKGYRSALTAKKNWLEIRFVKSKKVFLYNQLGNQKRKAYLVGNDLVYVIERKGKWCLIEFY